MTQATVREYSVQARSTDIFGRVLCSARNNHFVVDGPVQNGCPGEAVTPAELFLAGVAACGVELLQVIAREHSITLERVAVSLSGTVDRAKPVRQDVTVFNAVRLRFALRGVDRDRAAALVGEFKRR